MMLRRRMAAIVLASLSLSMTQGAVAAEPAKQMSSLMAVALNVADLEKSGKFYALLGYGHVTRYPATGTVREFILRTSEQGQDNTIVLAHAPDMQAAPGSTTFGRVLFRIQDGPAVVKKIQDAGFKIERTATAPGMTISFVRDPDGYLVELIAQQ
jgi:catechol 2,3-dioxygenase-like lactoylglutathione lyase family enzyme